MLAVEVGQGLAIGFLELTVENAAVRTAQVDACRAIVAGNLAQAAGGGLEHEVVAGPQPSRKGGGEEARAVPALGALVHEEDYTVLGRGVVQAIERIHLIHGRA